MIPVIRMNPWLAALKELVSASNAGMQQTRYDRDQRITMNCGIRRKSLTLCPCDTMSGTIVVRRAAAFPYRMDTRSLLESLRACLKEFPYFCGRLHQSAESWSIDGSDAGMPVSIIHHDRDMPAFGYQNSMKKIMHKLCEPLAFNQGNKDKPLVGIRITHYRNGTVIGISNSHVMMDGSGAWQFLQRWADHYRQQALPAQFTQDRRPLIFSEAEASQAVASPYYSATKKSKIDVGIFFARCLATTLTCKTIVMHIPGARLTEEKQKILSCLPKNQWVSTQDAAMALLVKPLLAITRKPNMVFGTIYNFRHLPELGLTPQYIGNAATAREFIMPRHSDTIAIAATLRQLADTLLPKHVQADLQYMQANIPLDEGLQHHAPFITQQFDDGVILNNYTKFPMYQVDFGHGTAIWADYPEVTLNRSITLLPDPQGDGVAAHITLPRNEMKSFNTHLKITESQF